jgi:large exoprotein involved in heme utilization and adhesion
LSDGGRFDARAPEHSLLTVAPVSAFGFLGETPGRIEINGGFLQVPAGQTLSLIGGDITLTNATIHAPGGRIDVAAVGSAGEVWPTATDLALQGFGAMGTLTMTREPFGKTTLGDLDASGESGGTIFIRGGRWVNRGSLTRSDVYGDQNGGTINIVVTGEVLFNDAVLRGYSVGKGKGVTIILDVPGRLELNGASRIITGASGAGDAGDVNISARDLFVDGRDSEHLVGIGSRSESSSTGAGGQVNIKVAETVILLNGGVIGTGTFGAGRAGNLTLSARNLFVDRQGSRHLTGIGSLVGPGATGDGGHANVAVTETLIVRNGGEIGSSTFGVGNAGVITIFAGNLLIDGQDHQGFTGIGSVAGEGSSGAGGKVNLVVADTINLLNVGQISASTQGSGSGGSIAVTVGRAVNIIGSRQTVGDDFLASGLFISSFGPGRAGDHLTITTPHLLLADGGGIFAQSFETTGGNLIINADHLKVLDGGYISASVFGDPTTQGGDVTLNSLNIVVLNGGRITAQAIQGRGGNIIVNAGVLLHDATDIAKILNASSQVVGNDGAVRNNAPTTDISGSLVALNTNYLDAAGQLIPRCGTGDPEARSRFTIQGRGALPIGPDSPAIAPAGRCGSESFVLVPAESKDGQGDGRSPAPLVEPPPLATFGFNNH